ncbi:MAG: NfeD family protein [Steroidobacteraceae bacterium]
MWAWFQQFDSVEKLFLGCAIVGGVMLLTRVLLAIAGLDHDGSDFDAPHLSSDSGFQFLTIQGLSSFLTMFGLVGFALYRNTTWGVLAAIILAIGAGLASVWLMQRIFLGMLRLQSSGTVAMSDAVGAEGTAYTNVTRAGGSVQILVANRLREYEAVSATDTTLTSGTRVRVERIAAGKLVVVPLD